MVAPGALAAAAALVVAGCSSGSSSSASSTSASAGASASAQPAGGIQLQDSYQKVIADVLPSVVQITTASGLGSGIVYDNKGDIVTNAHVVGTATTFTVTLANSTKPLDATLVASYPDSDLAVIRLAGPPGGLKPAVFGDSGKVQLGQITLAMGSPLGLTGSVTDGIVSATGRTVSEPDSPGSPGATIGNMVQTSAAINPGNSGGALVNLNSQVIGINTLAATEPETNGAAAPGIGFAIPASTVTGIADQLIKDGKVTNSGRAALGITARTYFDQDFRPAGAVVVAVSAGGPADSAGIQAGDVITKVGDTPVDSLNSLTTALASLTPGTRTTVTYTRDGQSKTAEVTLGTLGTP
ncbi:trypsin-like peptidase domain-containing protein [Streptomyces sp. CB01881]|uniref:S1C family serine protease n=1 Tax=Streptomyces sp. CB01881 TaxID=2078691 RepID=UPI000CDCAA58|nr:trypsin-like peptidase domain-containing protein [Streptomyces sp. CB01881]AUY54387.1 signal protein PDZ [Streptomyces sp. CB01881]TYC75291.1 PDZ domain-containing protein [Streptomyces sp. CB01881]